MNPDGPSATYRGYRRQALYALWRIVTEDAQKEYTYAPEGTEDLYLYDDKGTLCESVQVKDYSLPLTFSHFDPRKANCFFYRVHQRLTDAPTGQNTLVTFGPLGPELTNTLGTVTDQTAEAHKAAAKKLAGYYAEISVAKGTTLPAFSTGDGESVLQAIVVRHVQEETLTGEILAKLGPTVAGADPQVALGLLLYWVYRASEDGTRLSRTTLNLKLRQIGTALAALQSHHQEWHRTIVELPDEMVPAEEQQRLTDTYRAGVQATWRHILAKVDVLRDERLAEMKTKLNRHNVLLVHGASGQGKSTLAYRYLHENCAGAWRFQVTLLTGREHALNVCLALESQAAALALPVHVLVDVAPNDSGWPELVSRLARNPAIKVIVVIREEDFRRANFDTSSVALDQIDLDALTEAEARLLYAGIPAASTHFLHFDDAWNRFGGGGPLMEFTYLLQQGESLQNKLRQQLDRLRQIAVQGGEAITPAHLRLLALVSVAAEYECRLDTAKACAEVGLSVLLNPLAPFEREYLLRQFAEAGAVGGLHAIRSRFLVEHLFKADPKAWTDAAKACLSLLLPDDLDRFLLCVFSRRPADADALVAAATNLTHATWQQLGGITRALLWLGLSRYEEANRKLLEPVTTLVKEGWWFVFDGFVAQNDPHSFQQASQAAASMEPRLALIQEKVNPTPKKEVFAFFEAWVHSANPQISSPANEADWQGLAETAFWLSRRQGVGTIRTAADLITPEPALGTLPIESLSLVVLGLSCLGSPAFVTWNGTASATLQTRFLTDTMSLGITRSGSRLEVTYLVEPSAPNEKQPELEEQSLHRLRLLRGLFPEATEYAAQGLGLDSLPFSLPFDLTQKSILRENLPVPYEVRLNALFIALVNYRHLRGAGWPEIVAHYQQARQRAVQSLTALHGALAAVLAKRSRYVLWNATLDNKAWTAAGALQSQPLLPKPAVDEWGLGSEGRKDSALTPGAPGEARRQSAALAAYAASSKGLHDYLFSLGLFYSQFEEAVALCLLYRKLGTETLPPAPRTTADEQFIEKCSVRRRLCLINLANAIERLPAFQRAYRQLFLHRLDAASVTSLEASEVAALRAIWPACVQLMTLPLREVARVETYTRQEKELTERFLTALRAKLAGLTAHTINARVAILDGRWEGNPALWITARVSSVSQLTSLVARVGEALQEAVQRARLSEWEAYTLHLRWPKIVVVSQLNGRSLHRFAAGFSSLGLLHEGKPVSELDATGQVVSAPDWPRSLPVWDSPGVELLVRWVATTMDFVLHFQWIKHIYLALLEGKVTADTVEPLTLHRSQALNAVANPAARAFVDLEEYAKAQPALAAVHPRLHAWGRKIFPHLEASGEMRWELNAQSYFDHLEKMAEASTELPILMEELTVVLCPKDSAGAPTS